MGASAGGDRAAVPHRVRLHKRGREPASRAQQHAQEVLEEPRGSPCPDSGLVQQECACDGISEWREDCQGHQEGCCKSRGRSPRESHLRIGSCRRGGECARSSASWQGRFSAWYCSAVRGTRFAPRRRALFGMVAPHQAPSQVHDKEPLGWVEPAVRSFEDTHHFEQGAEAARQHSPHSWAPNLDRWRLQWRPTPRQHSAPGLRSPWVDRLRTGQAAELRRALAAGRAHRGPLRQESR
mmetsp:Transcript_27356/g.67508  ORF Transcript_27356/g.67508 Transcript_27356/m.67508 type:complete len:238 (+) Transcript_27356:506-1219(+)